MADALHEAALQAAQAEIERLRQENETLNGQMREATARQRSMELLMENCPDMLLLLDGEGRITDCTRGFVSSVEVPGAPPPHGQPYSKVFLRFATMDWIARFTDALHTALRERKTVRIDERAAFGKDAAPRSYAISITPLLQSGAPTGGAMVLFHDQTELLREKEEAEHASEAKSDFLAAVSHEVRAPMNAIFGLADMVMRTSLEETQAEYIKGIQNASQLLISVIDDILDLSSIEAGTLELAEVYYVFPALLDRIEEMFSGMFARKGIGFSVTRAPALPEVVFGDEKRVTQVLINLLSNALQYSAEGSVRLDVAADAPGWIRFDIVDTGTGIREEDIASLFQPFMPLGEMTYRNGIGAGLGLAITNYLCEWMQGSISVQSEYGKGSTFTVRLPMREGTRADLPQSVQPPPLFTAPGTRVLIVDDVDINVVVTAAMLQTFDIQSDAASGGEEALALAAENPYDLIFMDHIMPEMDGIEATQALRRMAGPNRAVPVVALTADAVSGTKALFLASGFHDYLAKPIDRDALARCLLYWLAEDKIVRA